jgi:hypothetical protein
MVKSVSAYNTCANGAENSKTDEQRSGRPSVSDETIAKVEETMLKDRRVTVRELCEMIPDVSTTCIATFAARRRVLRFKYKEDGTPHAKMH